MWTLLIYTLELYKHTCAHFNAEINILVDILKANFSIKCHSYGCYFYKLNFSFTLKSIVLDVNLHHYQLI